MTTDKPIDFGLGFCSKCQKCARECPAQAIPFGDKVLYNGYEIWKPDVEKCTKYRDQRQGIIRGRCMKMCPWNKKVIAASVYMWAATTALVSAVPDLADDKCAAPRRCKPLVAGPGNPKKDGQSFHRTMLPEICHSTAIHRWGTTRSRPTWRQTTACRPEGNRCR